MKIIRVILSLSLTFFVLSVKGGLALLAAENIPAAADGTEWIIYFTNIKNQEVPLVCTVAASERAKERGLMFKTSLEKNKGMIFLYDKEILLTFWMRNTSIPLSIAFVNAKNSVVDIFDMRPFDERIVSSSVPALYAVEANKGWFRRNFIYNGSKMRIVRNQQPLSGPKNKTGEKNRTQR